MLTKTDLGAIKKLLIPLEAGLENKIASIDSKVASLDSKVGSLDSKVTSVDSKVTSLSGKVASLDSKVVSLDSKVEALRRSNDKNHKEIINRMDLVDKALDRDLMGLTKRVAKVETHLGFSSVASI